MNRSRLLKLGILAVFCGSLLSGCGAGDGGGNDDYSSADPPQSTIADPVVDPIPSEPVIRSAYYSLPLPPDGFSSSIGWMQVIHDYREEANSTPISRVEIDWMRLWARVDGEDVLLTSDEYQVEDPEWMWFGLYLRDPWFEGDIQEAMAVEHDPLNGSLVITPSDWPMFVGHWWNTAYPRPIVPIDAERVWLECRVRIQGSALVQAGIDHWRTPTAIYEGPNVNNSEAGASDWFFADDNWQIISVGKPSTN